MAYGDCVVVPLASLLVPAPRYSSHSLRAITLYTSPEFDCGSVEALERGWEEIKPAKDINVFGIFWGETVRFFSVRFDRMC